MWNPTEFDIQKLITTNFDVDIWLSNPTTFLQDKMHTTFLQHLSKQKIEEYSELPVGYFLNQAMKLKTISVPTCIALIGPNVISLFTLQNMLKITSKKLCSNNPPFLRENRKRQ